MSKRSSCSTPVMTTRPLLRDPGLLPRRLREVAAELADVVERDVRHDARRPRRRRSSRRTRRRARSRDGGVDGTVEERLEREDGQQLEVRELVAEPLLDQLDERLRGTSSRSAKLSSSIGSSAKPIRSRTLPRSGEVYVPTVIPSSVRIAVAIASDGELRVRPRDVEHRDTSAAGRRARPSSPRRARSPDGSRTGCASSGTRSTLRSSGAELLELRAQAAPRVSECSASCARTFSTTSAGAPDVNFGLSSLACARPARFSSSAISRSRRARSAPTSTSSPSGR